MATLLHLKIRRELEEKIQRGDLPPGARLPTEAELQSQYGVSRATAQRALNELANAGLVVRRRRHGTFVADVRQQINLLNFAAPGAAEKGVPGRHQVVSQRIVRAGDAVVEIPGVDPDAAVVELVRVKLDLQERPRTLERHAILFSVAPNLLDEDLADFVSLRYFAAKKIPLGPLRVYLEPVVLGTREAELLESEAGVPAMQRRRETRTEDGTVIEAVVTVVRPGSAQFFVELPPPAL
ncbi:GntR family transcriptional regulator [Amycolatopsis sp. WAC 01416]|uniref:GntR family transcriptional regulator n=1 Tax=Amycolatopsis sp. WAC 01416 TaxID=2203196 RepID=UPI000F7BAFB6|nr:GntR family transcriptional regulator [Amycolatopsis sp. WAC 01416]RSN26266.1 GntR family transcriptional regulator [Amycolatopsis sp. WAC 01416]